ncbi:UNVERIFIED_ORG: hypothetical protein ABID33_002670 [Xanthobacter viscosus]
MQIRTSSPARPRACRAGLARVRPLRETRP